MSIKEACRFSDTLPHFLRFSNGLEIIAAAGVCKKGHQIIQESSELTGIVTQHFFSNACYIISGNPARFSTADYFLLGERHFDMRCRKLYQRLILQCAQHHRVIVLTEGFSSMTVVPPDAELTSASGNQSRPVKKYFGVSNIEYVGWDNPEARMKKREELQIDRIEQEISENQENMYMAIEERDSLAKESPERQKIAECIEKRWLIDEILYSRFELLDEQEMREIYPARTLSMVETLQQIEKMRIRGAFKRSVKVIVHCGAEHLRTATQKKGISEYNLDLLYKSLEKLNAIVMIPKFIDP